MSLFCLSIRLKKPREFVERSDLATRTHLPAETMGRPELYYQTIASWVQSGITRQDGPGLAG